LSDFLYRWLPSKHRQRQLSYLMELMLVGLLFIGIERRSVGIIVNTGVALAVTQLPSILERDYQLPMDPRITLWITAPLSSTRSARWVSQVWTGSSTQS
jgi:hypothetical protein